MEEAQSMADPRVLSRPQRLTALPSAVCVAREWARGQLCSWRRNEMIDSATLVVSELVTAGVRAVGAEAPRRYADLYDARLRFMTLRLALGRTDLLIEVWVHAEVLLFPQAVTDLGEHARDIVEILSREWGRYPHEGSTVIWATLGIPMEPQPRPMETGSASTARLAEADSRIDAPQNAAGSHVSSTASGREEAGW